MGISGILEPVTLLGMVFLSDSMNTESATPSPGGRCPAPESRRLGKINGRRDRENDARVGRAGIDHRTRRRGRTPETPNRRAIGSSHSTISGRPLPMVSLNNGHGNGPLKPARNFTRPRPTRAPPPLSLRGFRDYEVSSYAFGRSGTHRARWYSGTRFPLSSDVVDAAGHSSSFPGSDLACPGFGSGFSNATPSASMPTIRAANSAAIPAPTRD